MPRQIYIFKGQIWAKNACFNTVKRPVLPEPKWLPLNRVQKVLTIALISLTSILKCLSGHKDFKKV